MPPPCGDAGRPVSHLDEVPSFRPGKNKSTSYHVQNFDSLNSEIMIHPSF